LDPEPADLLILPSVTAPLAFLSAPWLAAAGALLVAGPLAARRVGRRRARDLARYLGPGGAGGSAAWRAAAKTVLTAAALAALALGLAGPLYGHREVQLAARGADVVLAVDVSPSMGAADAKPSRLRLAVHRAGELLDALPGHRVALVAFAGGADTLVPLTLDHDAVRMGLDALEPGMVPKGGTSLEAGIATAAEAIRDGGGGGAVVLLSDGEATAGDLDPAVRAARKAGTRVFALGVGGTEGAPVPVHDETGALTGYKRDRDGTVVTSRLERGPLRELAQATGGTYHDADLRGEGTAAVAAALRTLAPQTGAMERIARPEDRYQWPLAAALALLTSELLLPGARRRLV
jgi:Ca-activated chloride channel family protein